MSEAVTPIERLRALLPEKNQKLKLLKESNDPVKTISALKKKVRNMFGYFKNSIAKSYRGKILQ